MGEINFEARLREFEENQRFAFIEEEYPKDYIQDNRNDILLFLDYEDLKLRLINGIRIATSNFMKNNFPNVFSVYLLGGNDMSGFYWANLGADLFNTFESDSTTLRELSDEIMGDGKVHGTYQSFVYNKGKDRAISEGLLSEQQRANE